jgi:uncharacterized protein (DUF2236 family)
VTEADLECELAMLRAEATGRLGGVFGPGSMVWHIDREAAVFLAAGRALLLQLAHPWVAAAIAEHSRSLADPIGRFHRRGAALGFRRVGRQRDRRLRTREPAAFGR